MMTSRETTSVQRRRGLSAPLALPAGFAALLAVGAAAASGGLPAAWVLILAAVIVAAGSLVAELAAAPLLGVIGWLTVIGFSRAPYAQLRLTGPLPAHAAVIILVCCLAGAGAGAGVRRMASGFTLWIMDVSDERSPEPDPWTASLPEAGLSQADCPGCGRTSGRRA